MARFQIISMLAAHYWLIAVVFNKSGISAFVVDRMISTRPSTKDFTPHSIPLVSTTRFMSVTDETKADSSNLPFFLDPNTKGGVLVLMTTLFVVTWLCYQFIVNVLGYDEIDAGIGVGMGFTVISTLAWMSTYLFRVVTKDMTYVSSGLVAQAFVQRQSNLNLQRFLPFNRRNN
jgi:Protein of unknown function (DUF3007)